MPMCRSSNGHLGWRTPRRSCSIFLTGTPMKDKAMITEAELQRQNERLDLLLNLTSRITSNLDLRELLRATSANIRNVVQADAAGVAFFDEGSNKSRIYALDFPKAKGFVKEELVVTPGQALKRAWGSSKAVIVNTNDREELGPEIYDLVVA